MAAFTSRLRSWLAPRRLGRWAFIEVVILTLALALAAVLMFPDDPFLLSQPFPWLWLGPLLLALRYGTMAAFTSTLLLMAAWQGVNLLGHGTSAFPSSFFLGGLLLTLVAGEFADLWSSRLRRADEARGYFSERLEALTRNHYLLRLSHERLEQQQLLRPLTLQDALQNLRALMAQAPAAEALPQAQEVLRLMGQACQLEAASLHGVDAQQRPRPEPLACLGEGGSLQLHDPLVQCALERNALCHVQTEGSGAGGSRYLVVAPLSDSSGRLAGLLAVERLPFLSLNQETLCFLAVLGGYYADSLRLAPAARQLQARLPQCPQDFAGELLRLHRIQQDTGLVSCLLAVVVEAQGQQDDIARRLQQQARALDVLWSVRQGERCFVFILMPLQGEAALTGCAHRLERWLKESYGCRDLAAAGVTLHSGRLDEPPEALLRTLLTRCGYVWT